ncbi:hypothetical protein OVN18_09470 [Microcella daejeonensis]|uniref:Uncharacterized protein n=1 Tax=Microcella daejeonensis TaxID=2994971 RepID=A0A9E8S8D0_9MICO|nr:hypothetical protein [Microcella daejeonensis]WAB80794.1 hypothetical protein OVN18_09470 [Microcella daejeonensis]
MFKRWRNQRPPVPRDFIEYATRPWLVIVYAGFVSFVIADLVAAYEGLAFSGFLGLWATLWALVLAALIFVINAGEQRQLREEIVGLQGSMSEMVESLLTKQSEAQLAAAKDDYRDYLDELLRMFPAIPESDIVTVERLPGKGNLPVIIETKLRRYSVWRGGRNGGFHITKLSDPNGQAV